MVSASAEAHRTWLLPSATVLSGKDAWVTVDAAVSNDLFYFEHHPLQLDQSVDPGARRQARSRRSTSPRASSAAPSTSSWTQPGTYKMAVLNQGVFANYKLNGEAKRWRGKPEQIATEIPAAATEVKLSEVQGRIEIFVTSGKPSDSNLKPTGIGLELLPVTHPNNLVAGEKATFRMVLDGKPAAGLAGRDRAGRQPLSRQAQRQQGHHRRSRHRSASPGPAPACTGSTPRCRTTRARFTNAKRRAGYTATLEVLPQ